VTREPYGYRLLFGHRRRDAAIIAGLEQVPCLLLPSSDDEEAVLPQVIENMQRLELNDMEKSRALAILVERLHASGLAQGEALAELAKMLGLSPPDTALSASGDPAGRGSGAHRR